MDPLSALITGLWVLVILSRPVALIALAIRSFWTRYPALVLVLSGQTICDALLLAEWHRAGAHAYNAMWVKCEPFVIALHVILALGAYILMCRHAQGFRWAAVLVGAVFAVFSGALVCGAFGWLPGTALPVINESRYYRSASLVFLWLCVGFFRWVPTAFSRNVSLHVRAVSVLLMSTALEMHLENFDLAAKTVGRVVALGAELWVLWIWIVRLNRDGEASPPPLPPGTEEEYREADSWWETMGRRAREAFRDRWYLPSLFVG